MDDLGNLVREIISYPRKLGEVAPFVQHVGYIARQVFNGARSVAVGSDPERICAALDFKQDGIALEKAGDLGVVDRHGRAVPSKLLRPYTTLARQDR